MYCNVQSLSRWVRQNAFVQSVLDASTLPSAENTICAARAAASPPHLTPIACWPYRRSSGPMLLVAPLALSRPGGSTCTCLGFPATKYGGGEHRRSCFLETSEHATRRVGGNAHAPRPHHFLPDRLASQGTRGSEGVWKGADALVIDSGAASEEDLYSKSASLQTWLLGYEFPETVILVCSRSVAMLTSKKKGAPSYLHTL